MLPPFDGRECFRPQRDSSSLDYHVPTTCVHVSPPSAEKLGRNAQSSSETSSSTPQHPLSARGEVYQYVGDEDSSLAARTKRDGKTPLPALLLMFSWVHYQASHKAILNSRRTALTPVFVSTGVVGGGSDNCLLRRSMLNTARTDHMRAQRAGRPISLLSKLLLDNLSLPLILSEPKR